MMIPLDPMGPPVVNGGGGGPGGGDGPMGTGGGINTISIATVGSNVPFNQPDDAYRSKLMQGKNFCMIFSVFD